MTDREKWNALLSWLSLQADRESDARMKMAFIEARDATLKIAAGLSPEAIERGLPEGMGE